MDYLTTIISNNPLHLILWIGWAVLLFGGFIIGKPTANNPRRMPTWGRLGSSLVLVVAAWLWLAQVSAQTPLTDTTFLLLLAIGMTFGFIGDIFMAKGITIGGIGAFGIGHVAYIASFFSFMSHLHVWTRELPHPAFVGVVAAWLLVGLIGWVIVLWRNQDERGFLHWAALGYCLLLSATAGVATGVAISYERNLWLLALGAALFLLSDLIIAAGLFQKWKFPFMDDVIWLTYGPAQMLIVFIPPMLTLAIFSTLS